jgi:hypothetical protein
MGRLLAAPASASALTIGDRDDALEHEADRLADQAMRAPEAVAAASPAPVRLSRTCAACEEADRESRLRRKGDAAAAGAAPASVAQALGGPSQPLDAATRAFFEPRFGLDFGEVRVRTGAAAARSARDVNAQAYTVGRDIVFAANRFAPATPEGRRLIAHELAHVVQQSGAGAGARAEARRVMRAPGDQPPGPGPAEPMQSGKAGAVKAPPGLCGGPAKGAVKMGNAIFALCDFTDVSQMVGGAVPWPGNVEFRALKIAIFATLGSQLPNAPPGSKDDDWEHGFIQTVQSLKYVGKYKNGWSLTWEVATPRRDATGAGVPAPWYANEPSPLPSYQYTAGKKLNTIAGPITLGPAPPASGVVGILDDPQNRFPEKLPSCRSLDLDSFEASGELDTWLVVTEKGKGQNLSELGFLRHKAVSFAMTASASTNFTVQGTPSSSVEDGQGAKTPVLTGPVANDDLKKPKIVQGSPCPGANPGPGAPIAAPKQTSADRR